MALDRLQAARTYEILHGRSCSPTRKPAQPQAAAPAATSPRPCIQTLRPPTARAAFKQINDVGGFDAVWQIDVFGKYRREIEAARADSQAEPGRAKSVLVCGDRRRRTRLRRPARSSNTLLDLHAPTDACKSRCASCAFGLRTRHYQRARCHARHRELAVAGIASCARRCPGECRRVHDRHAARPYPEDLLQELRRPAMIPTCPGWCSPAFRWTFCGAAPTDPRPSGSLAGATARIGVATAIFSRRSAFRLRSASSVRDSGFTVWPTHLVGRPGAVWPLLDFGALDAQVEIADCERERFWWTTKDDFQDAVKDVDTAWGAFGAEQERQKDSATQWSRASARCH